MPFGKESFSVKETLESQSEIGHKKEAFIPLISGFVTVELDNFQHVFKASEGNVFIYDAVEKDGELFFGFGGQSWNYLICSIPQNVIGFWEIRRNVHLQYLLQLEEAINKEEDRVLTIFGWKKLEYKKGEAKARPRVGGFKKLF